MVIRAFKSFLKDEDGLATVEIVIILAVLVGVALIFRKQVYDFVSNTIEKIFKNAGDPVYENPDKGGK